MFFIKKYLLADAAKMRWRNFQIRSNVFYRVHFKQLMMFCNKLLVSLFGRGDIRFYQPFIDLIKKLLTRFCYNKLKIRVSPNPFSKFACRQRVNITWRICYNRHF